MENRRLLLIGAAVFAASLSLTCLCGGAVLWLFWPGEDDLYTSGRGVPEVDPATLTQADVGRVVKVSGRVEYIDQIPLFLRQHTTKTMFRFRLHTARHSIFVRTIEVPEGVESPLPGKVSVVGRVDVDGSDVCLVVAKIVR